ncbi:MAG: DUF1772 domain-containing protein [Planctomycetota bacterium]
MILYLTLLAVATALVALVGGFLVAFLLVVMPGLARLPDAGFVRGFQVIDGVIQDGEPRFGLLWLGSALAVLVAAIAGWFVLPTLEAGLVTLAAGLFLIGLQLPTFVRNVPLNNALQRVEVDNATPDELASARRDFELTWNRWNTLRTAVALISTAVLLVVLVRVSPA